MGQNAEDVIHLKNQCVANVPELPTYMGGLGGLMPRNHAEALENMPEIKKKQYNDLTIIPCQPTRLN